MARWSDKTSKTRGWGRIVAVSCILWLAAAVSASAQGTVSMGDLTTVRSDRADAKKKAEGIRLGGMVLMPSIGYKVEYNDNVFLENTGEDEDFIHRIQPNVIVQANLRGGLNFMMGYDMELVAYTDLDENNYIAHRPFFHIDYASPTGFYLKFDDRFVQTEDPYGSDYNTYGLGEQTKRTNNAADLVLGYRFGQRYGIEGSYSNFVEHYDKSADKWQNRMDNILGLSFLYNLTAKTALFGQYRFTTADYTSQNDGIVTDTGLETWNSGNSQDYDIHAVFFGARFAPGGKLSGEAKIGYSAKNFQNDADFLGRGYEDTDAFVIETNVAYQMRPRTNLSLRINRAQRGSPDREAASYIDSLIGVYAIQGIGERFEVGADAEWNNQDYQDEYATFPEKSYNTYNARLRASWNLRRWLSGGVGYTFQSKNASDNAYASDEYDNSILWAAIKGKF